MRAEVLFTFLLTLPLAVFSDDLPTVCIAVLVRNKEHSLPYFLGGLERLSYPKEKIVLWMILDHSVDKSQQILESWLPQARENYRQVHYVPTPKPTSYRGQVSDSDWPEERMERVIILRTAAMSYAREVNADYLFYLDADAILMNPATLQYLVSLKKTIVAPMLNSTGLYSNFWAGMDERGYYRRTEQYKPILFRHIQGVINVPMVHSAFLVDVRDEKSKNLAFRPSTGDAPFDDMISFGLSARETGIRMYIANTDFFGYIPVPRGSDHTLESEVVQFRELVTSRTVLEFDGFIPEPFNYDVVERTKFGFDEIYLINLLRRPDRTEKMKRLLRVFNIDYRYFPAVDGKQLNDSYLSQIGVKMLEGYLDPFHKRPLTMGEIGCFLSHHYIWEDMIKNGYKRILILEDDAFLQPNFNSAILAAVSDADRFVPQWHLLYTGRKILDTPSESYVYGSSHLVHPSYSYWTVSYALTLSGAKKLLAAKPLSKMVAVDEFLPIMYNRNMNVQWLDAFPERDLIAVSVNPLIAYPQLFTSQGGYYSDTEAAVLIEQNATQQKPTITNPAQAEAAEAFARSEL